MRTYHSTARHAQMIIVAAGLALPAVAQNADRTQQDQRRTMTQPEREGQRHAQDSQQIKRLSFHRASDLLGKDINNIDGDSIGSLDNAIIDRGSGKITHIVIRSGGILGYGGELIAIPFEAFTYDVGEKAFMLPVGTDDLEASDANSRSGWRVLDTGEFENDLRELGDSMRRGLSDAYDSAFGDETEHSEVTGVIVGVNRWENQDGQEYVSVDVVPEDKQDRVSVLLGPAWYVMSDSNAPMRDQRVTIETVPSNNGNADYVATNIGSDSSNLELRSRDGAPLWIRDTSRSSMLMLGSVLDMDASSRTEQGGEIQDALIEANSGRVAMLVFDPNENILGLGDDLICVPWSASVIGKDAVIIDASEDVLGASSGMPEDLETLTSRESLRPLYAPYGTDVTSFARRQSTQRYHTDRDMDHTGDRNTDHNKDRKTDRSGNRGG